MTAPAPAPTTKAQLIFGHEPAFWIGFIQGLIAILTAFGLSLTTDQQGAIMAVVSAVMGAWLAWAVRPISVAAFVAVIQAALALLVSFGLDLTMQQQGVVLTLAPVILNVLLVRPQVTPARGWLAAELAAYRSVGRHRKAGE